MRKSDLDADQLNAYSEIKELIEHSTPDLVWAMHFVATGMARELIVMVVLELIVNGNTGLQLEFPQLARDVQGASHGQ